MSESDLLLTLAEVAVAFAGFASLVGILGHRTSVDDPRILGARMRAMLLTSLLVVAFSLIPLVLDRFAPEPDTVWAVSTIGLLIGTTGYLAWILGYFRRLGRSDIAASRLQRFVILPTLYVTFLSLAVLLLTNVVLRSPAIYIAALALLLAQSGFAFVLIVFSFLPQIDPETPQPAAEDPEPGSTDSDAPSDAG